VCIELLWHQRFILIFYSRLNISIISNVERSYIGFFEASCDPLFVFIFSILFYSNMHEINYYFMCRNFALNRDIQYGKQNKSY